MTTRKRSITMMGLGLGLVIAASGSALWARGPVSLFVPGVNFSGTDKAPANVPINVKFQDNVCVGAVEGCVSDVPACAAGKSVVLHWGTVDGNGNWTSSNDTYMSCSEGGPPTCGSWTTTWSADIPAQSNGTKIEFVFHVFGGGVDKWLKDSGRLTGSWSQCVGNPSLKGWHRVPALGGSNFYYSMIETPYVTLDFPQENEVITAPSYTIRIGANGSTNNVRVKIDTGDWAPARFAAGYWWFDWANYPAGPHQIIAEGWNELGQRTETSIRNCTYQP